MHGYMTITPENVEYPNILAYHAVFRLADCLWDYMGTGTCYSGEWRMWCPGVCGLRAGFPEVSLPTRKPTLAPT